MRFMQGLLFTGCGDEIFMTFFSPSVFDYNNNQTFFDFVFWVSQILTCNRLMNGVVIKARRYSR